MLNHETKVIPQRKYEALWLEIKEKLIVEVELAHYTQLRLAHIERSLKTIRKAVQKEKYADYHFKIKYPNSEIVSELIIKHGIIKFNLELDNSINYKELF